MPTVGGASIDITGTDVGLTSSVVTVRLTGGSAGLSRRSHTLPPGACTVVHPGTTLRCPSAPGVGANYSFVVAVDGGASDPSADTLSYAPPGINALDGPGSAGAPARGGSFIYLRGSNFGPADDATIVVTAWATPAANDSLVFPGGDCVVVEAHVAVRCVVTAGAGAAVSWRVSVEGQANAMPLASYAAPTLDAAAFADPNVTQADTQGGTRLLLRGRDLWNNVAHVAVVVTTPAGASPVPACAFVAVDTTLECILPPGAGAITLVTVTVLGQTATLAPMGLAYATPVVASVTPSAWPTDLSAVTVSAAGTGFGPPSQAQAVSVVVTGTACGGGAAAVNVSLPPQNLVVRSDADLGFDLRLVVAHVVPVWTLGVSVAGQRTAQGPRTVPTRRPAVSSLAFESTPNGTHYFLVVTGADFGPAVGTDGCPGDVAVSIDGVPCDALTMAKVGVCGVGGVPHGPKGLVRVWHAA
jgi:hypothetical protein